MSSGGPVTRSQPASAPHSPTAAAQRNGRDGIGQLAGPDLDHSGTAATADAVSPEESSTREEILRLIVTEGPIRAQEIASRLHLAAAGIRRHLGELERDGLIEDHEVASPRRGRGRPPRHFVATARAHDAFGSQVDGLAVEALTYVSQLGGREAVDVFAATRGLRLAERYGQTVQAAGTDVAARAQALAEAMNRDGFAATLRPGPGSLTLQLCLGHCPVHQVARAFPELCEAETQAISRLLGVHVQRLATLAGGEHVCTTCVPVALGIAEADADNEGAQ